MKMPMVICFSFLLSFFLKVYIFADTCSKLSPKPSRPPPSPMSVHYSEIHWGWVHSLWHLPSAVHDCGEIYGALYSVAPIDLHLPDTVTDRASQPIMAQETDRLSFYRWDEVGWPWLMDRLSLNRWGITESSLHCRSPISCGWMSESVHTVAFESVCTYSIVWLLL